MSDTLRAIWDNIDDERLVELTMESLDQYSPSYAEEPAMSVFAAAFSRKGIPFQRQPIPEREDDTGGNLVVKLGPEPVGLLWVGHVDTVAYSDEDQDTRLEGDTLFGLGASDMKSACAAAVEAAIATVESGVKLQRGLCLALVVGEEEYGDGAETLLESVWAPLTVVGEPTGLAPCLDHYGYYECRLTTSGTQAHAALPELGSSAIHDMLAWLMEILDVASGDMAEVGLVVNPRTITGGAGSFVVADSCEALLDVHVPPQTDPAEIARLLSEAQTRALIKNPNGDFQFEELFWAPGFAVDSEQTVLDPLRRAFDQAGRVWNLGVFRSHSDASSVHAKGSVPLVCGPGRLEVAHTRHEHVELQQVRDAARLYAAMIHEACIADR